MSERAVKGYVTYVNEKEWSGRNGTVTLYSFKIEGDDTYYRTGRKNPNLQRGQFVKFTVDGQDVDMDTVERGEVKDTVPTKSGGGGGSRDSYWKDKEAYDKTVVQPRIAYCAARHDAVALAAAALEASAISLGTKKADQLPNLVEIVTTLTADLLSAQDEFLGQEVAKSAEKSDEIPEDAWEDE